MTYLEKLKARKKNSQIGATPPLTKPTKAPFVSFVTPLPTPVEENFSVFAKTKLNLEDFEERAGILEYEAWMPRHKAEFLARCDQCRRFSKYGNCRMPQESCLTVRFELIQAPGPACQIFEAKPLPVPY
ncbi:hypothetical protein [Ferrovum myxofaciens]|uniref:hypothetical protein n=1 Tax=Ferrovum myxofaciens TaxID=416213 RepID=UPI002352B459|nr:hypothetical protein [Ferrovum myxofaciens]MBU6994037.1 hypothetical protein [Ferrovum myxofaciens]